MTTTNQKQQPEPHAGPVAQQLVKLQANGQQVPSSQPNIVQPSGKKNKWGFADKTIWDWLNLSGTLAIPLVVVGATIAFGIIQADLAQKQHDSDQAIANQQHAADQQQALDQQRATTLQTYIDNIQDLLLNHNLLKSKPSDDVAILARARTLTALQGLDGTRKGVLVQFLYEAHLIGFLDSKGNRQPPIVDLTGADLSGAFLLGNIYGAVFGYTFLSRVNLSGADLSGANLSGADLLIVNLSEADLSGADLYKAGLVLDDLSEADLNGSNLILADLNGSSLILATFSRASLNEASLDTANLSGADLSTVDLRKAFLGGADLTGANLNGAGLNGADLTNADLKGAIITSGQLAQVNSLKGATMPNGSKHP